MKVLKKHKGLIIFVLVAAFLVAALFVGKTIFLARIKERIQSSFHYGRIRLAFFPPALVLDDVRSLSADPYFSARRITVGISYVSLLRKEKPLIFFVEQPVLRITEKPGGDKKPRKPFFPLPFPIEKGLVRDGEVYYWRKEGYFQAQGVKALLGQKDDAFSFQSEAERTTFSPSSSALQFGGAMKLSLSGKGKEITIHRATLEGRELMLKAGGRLFNPLDSGAKLELRTVFNGELAVVADILDFPFEWQGKTEGRGNLALEGRRVVFETSLLSRALVLNKVPLGRAEGRLSINGLDNIHIDLNVLRTGSLPEDIALDIRSGRVEGRLRGAFLDPIMLDIGIPWPVLSPVWGSFTFDKGQLDASGEFRDEASAPEGNKYPFQGEVKVRWVKRTKDVIISSPRIRSSFGEMEADARLTIGRDLDIGIKGQVSDLKQAREFTALILNKSFLFPEIRGRGAADIRIQGDFGNPRVSSSFSLTPGGFAPFDAGYVEGAIEILGSDVLGRFRVDDPSYKGEIGLSVHDDKVRAEIKLAQGYVEKILPPLEINFSLSGRAGGNFTVIQSGEDITVEGDFSGDEMVLLGQAIKDAGGRFVWKDATLLFPKLEFGLFGGQVKGRCSFGFGGFPSAVRSYDIDMLGENLDLSLADARLKGGLALAFKGRGEFGKEKMPGTYQIKSLLISPFRKVDAAGGLKLDLVSDELSLDIDGSFLPGENGCEVRLRLPLGQDRLNAAIKGHFTNLDLLLPWRGAKGRLNYLAELDGPRLSPQVNGGIDFQCELLPLPQFAHAMTDVSGLVHIQSGKASVRSFQAKLGGGDVVGAGDLFIGRSGVETIDVRLDGKNMVLAPLERSRALTDGFLRLIKDSRRFVLEGDFLVRRLSWRREITEKFGFSSAAYPARREPGFFDDLTLNIRLRGSENAYMENSLGKVSGRFDLTISGNVNAPLITGEIEGLGGEVYFQDRKFRVLRARLNFFNPTSIEPYLDFRGETYVKDYRVTFGLSGLINNLKPEFSSSPPLPPEDVLALLALGEAFKRTYSYDTATQLSTASLLSFRLSEQAQKRAEGLFSLARFRIDPFVMGTSSEMAARLTVGRMISRNVSILYSTNLTTHREEMVRMEWEVSRDFSLVGIRNEWGRISFDLKWRKRF